VGSRERSKTGQSINRVIERRKKERLRWKVVGFEEKSF